MSARARLALIAVGAVIGAVVVTPAPATADTGIDATDRASVTAAYLREWAPAQRVQSAWSGSVAGCSPGGVTEAAQSSTLQAINFARRLEGLDPARFDAAYSEQAQAAALMMRANGQLSHTPPESWKCYSEAGADGAHSSNLYLGTRNAQAIRGYLDDPGDSNTFVGHRRWILAPSVATMGHGATDESDALKVFGAAGFASSYSNPAWVAWPAAGYFPVQLEPEGRWSLSGQKGHDWDFSAASVTVRNPAGAALPVHTYPQTDGYGADTLVWSVSGLDVQVGTGQRDYAVTVSGIRNETGTTSFDYTVRLIDPEAKPAPPVRTAPRLRTVKQGPKIVGSAKVGRVLSAVDPRWSPAPEHRTYQWLRNGRPIAKATKRAYTVTAKDRRARITLRITALADHGYGRTSLTTMPTKPVR